MASTKTVLWLLLAGLIFENEVAGDTGCSTVTLNHPDDVFCNDETCQPGQPCECAVYLRGISGSCITVCEGFGMTCTGRHGDGPGDGHRCDYFDARTVVEQCGDTGDSDDVCICSKQSPGTPVPPTTSPISVPTPPTPPPSTPWQPSPQPTELPILTTACAAVSLNHPDDEFCSDEPCVPGGTCTCAVYLRQISGSCITVCEGFDMTCAARHGDGPGAGHRCDYFNAGTVVEQCGDTGDSDDVCVCAKQITTAPAPAPTPSPSPAPTPSPTLLPTAFPTMMPSTSPTPSPTMFPTAFPTLLPTSAPTAPPTGVPTYVPTMTPTQFPTVVPTQPPSLAPTPQPPEDSGSGSGGSGSGESDRQTPNPTVAPSTLPTTSPTPGPTRFPTPTPTLVPTRFPTLVPTLLPTAAPTQAPTLSPSPAPSPAPSRSPTPAPSETPTPAPSRSPTHVPTPSPTPAPTREPTLFPTSYPSSPLDTSACSTVSLNHPDDEICSDAPCVGGICTCAVYLRQISESCITVCEGFGMTCTGRHGDGPGEGHRCDYFNAGTVVEQCGDTGDSDDVCVCSKTSGPTPPSASPTPSPPTLSRAPSLPPTLPPTQPPQSSPSGPLQQANSISFGGAEMLGNLPSQHSAAESQGLGFENKLYYFGGFSQNWATMNKKASMYTPENNRWTSLPDMPLPFGGTGITHMGNAIWPEGRQIILTGGLSLGYTSASRYWPQSLSRQEVFTLNVDSRSWGRLPDMPGDRGGMGAAVVGSTLYVFGGGTFGWAGNRWDFLADHTDTWSLNLNNPNAGWSTRGRMRTARNHIGAAAVNGIVYALGGQNLEMEGCTNKNAVEAFNPATNRWTTISSMPVKLGHIGPSVLSPSMGFNYGMIVVSGTTDSGNSCSPPGNHVSSAQYYRPFSQSWQRIGGWPIPGASAVTAILEVNGNTYIYVTVREYDYPNRQEVIQKLMRARVYIN